MNNEIRKPQKNIEALKYFEVIYSLESYNVNSTSYRYSTLT